MIEIIVPALQKILSPGPGSALTACIAPLHIFNQLQKKDQNDSTAYRAN